MEEATTTLIVLKELAGNPLPKLNAIQSVLAPHADLIVLFWKIVFVITTVVLLWKLWYDYRKTRGA